PESGTGWPTKFFGAEKFCRRKGPQDYPRTDALRFSARQSSSSADPCKRSAKISPIRHAPGCSIKNGNATGSVRFTTHLCATLLSPAAPQPGAQDVKDSSLYAVT